MKEDKIVELIERDMAVMFYKSHEGKRTIGVFEADIARAIVEVLEMIGQLDIKLAGADLKTSLENLSFLARESQERKAGRIPRG